VRERGRLSAPGDLKAPEPEGPSPAGRSGTSPDRPGSLSGPGSLAAAATTAPAAPAGGENGEPLAALATRYGLKPSAERPKALAYLRQLWQRRHFIAGFATARNVAMYTEARLGQLWQVLTPLLNAAVYFLIFGELLRTSRGVPNFVPFLVTGVFVFNFTQRSVITSSGVIRQSLPLIRALYFPRACLPLGYVLIELQQLMLSFAVLFVIVAAFGEPLTGYWLLIIPALLLQTLFNVGAGLILARWGAGFDDVTQLLPFIVRTWMYASGVLFSIQSQALIVKSVLWEHPTVAYLMQINPAAVYITLARNALLTSQRTSMPGAQPYNASKCAMYQHSPDLPGHQVLSAFCHPVVSTPSLWLYGAGWAVLAVAIGFVFFWRAETRYGRG
jgi:teichoic acid transport system permease protein